MVSQLTDEALDLIRSEHHAGKSCDDIALTLRDRLGIDVQRRTIENRLYRMAVAAGTPRRKPGRPSRIEREGLQVPPPGPASPQTQKKLRRKAKATLDEVASLRLQISRLEDALDKPLPPREMAAVSKELRDAYKQLRVAMAVAKGPGIVASQAAADAEAVIERLRRLQAAQAAKKENLSPPATTKPNGLLRTG